MKELVVISGKGGTGKTSLVASFAVLAAQKVMADCDVDAADLHLILDPAIVRRTVFTAGREAVIRAADCLGGGAHGGACGGVCREVCRYDAISPDGGAPRIAGMARPMRIDPLACEGCGVCVNACPRGAIDFPERTCGEWFISDTRHGPLVHARLEIGAENSGKLVSQVRQAARTLAEERALDLIIVDGPPGIGCPVIASITGASLVLVVTEPTVSGAHDLARIVELARHFRVPAALCLNKWDLNPALADQMANQAERNGLRLAGRIRYDRGVTRAQLAGQSVVEHRDGSLAAEFREVWRATRTMLNEAMVKSPVANKSS